ncbi:MULTISPECIES: 1-acyl-sn-glycerol-3-phosphate acyltransferase [unclassified Pseudomonas]|uniref:lysophospholipid acyltransferase family protein n=1 Tax=unclassified Pseudomonas TaxID=196821 RepID=UPI000BCFF6C1|nr:MULTISPECIES: lysophospholipid acyltransferase family protein [unclassified Pseudomonas]PVZ16220.1 1-acyl-sn-glycerol-3-phosphate acyltransferase [Pseudomonas sp. URIL14HWK12:I12]PVZ25924.1 1-acyl-sn-glycerol-3-phosphate acyltransferase [Pseudomonas sp. URIL14HWK12:I10]PVZ36552.1 1-acyl-sn-glycerol-3-phosphate acyltransferase [Pseudomonas sp. URIL14HWK12:I11]SNZ13191.1 lyso-ornithine lipid acyltransferase [Pseudomonas sp. URIL14HWK12:I9]
MRALRLGRILLVVAMGLCMAATLWVARHLGIPDRQCRRQRWTRCFMAALCRALPYRIHVHGKLPDAPMLWLSNHVSWVDIAVLGQLTPLVFLAKDEVRQWPIAGRLAASAGTFFVCRGASDGQRLRLEMGKHLRQQGPLVIFPEGTTTDGRDVRTFHGRLLACAVEQGVPVQPVALRYLRDGQRCDVSPFIGDDDLVSHLLRLLRQPLIDVHVHLLPPIPSTGKERAALAHASQAAVRSALQSLPVATPASGPVASPA